MADIFLSYAREDLAKAKLLAAALEKQGWSVFWDRTSLLAGQDFEEVIEQAIEQAGCMIVAWPKASKKSDWVRGEANIGRQRKILVPILFDSVDPPIAFRSLHTENFAAWKGETDSFAYLALCKALNERIGQGIPSTSGTHITSHHSSNGPNMAKIHWSKQLTLKLGKITAIAITLTILLWTVVPVLLSQKDEPIPSEGTSADLGVSVPLTGRAEIQAPSAEINVSDQPPIKEPEMVRIPAGSFQMGSNNGDADEKPVHPVDLKSFAIGRYEVTYEEYAPFVVSTGSKGFQLPYHSSWNQGKYPVISTSWIEAKAYADWLSEKTGKSYRLPTEAEWEYAARAGSITDYYWGEQDTAEKYAWFHNNSGGKTHPVGEKQANAFGLYDMSGNLLEWVQDCYHENYYKAPRDGRAWLEENKDQCQYGVLRGGYWGAVTKNLRSANRFIYSPNSSLNGEYGFRLAQD